MAAVTTLIENVTCLSNASLDIFPNNSLTKFTHRLPKPIKVPPGLKPLVALREFVLSNYPSENASKVGFLKVHLEEIDPLAGPDVNDRRLLSTLQNKSGKTIWNRPDFPVLCPLAATDQIEQLSFLVTDEWNRQLQLKSGPTTVIHLTIVMTNAQNSFTMSVGPDTSRHLFAHNSLPSFSVEMPETLTLDENWEVALLSAQAGSSVVLEDSRMKFVLHTKRQQKESDILPTFGAHADDKVKIVPMKRDKMSDVNLVRKVLQPWLKEFGFDTTLDTEDGSIAITRERPPEDVVESIMGSPMEQQEIPDTHNAIISLELCPHACKMLRMVQTDPRGKIINLNHTKIGKVYVRNRMLDYGIRYYSETKYPAEAIHHMAVYCDLVEHSIIGNEIAPIMTVMPTKRLHLHDVDQEAFYSVKHPVFRPINPHVRKTFDVALRSLDGSVPPLIYDGHDFAEEKHPIRLTFVFRRAGQ